MDSLWYEAWLHITSDTEAYLNTAASTAYQWSSQFMSLMMYCNYSCCVRFTANAGTGSHATQHCGRTTKWAMGIRHRVQEIKGRTAPGLHLQDVLENCNDKTKQLHRSTKQPQWWQLSEQLSEMLAGLAQSSVMWGHVMCFCIPPRQFDTVAMAPAQSPRRPRRISLMCTSLEM